MIPLSDFPVIDATLKGASALLLTLGYFFIRRKNIQAHKVCMLSAFATSTFFLVCYIWYHARHGASAFPEHACAIGHPGDQCKARKRRRPNRRQL
jgi:putative membrane protein